MDLPTTFGKYFLTEKLATGGMAEIYLAKLTGPGGFEKQLVIKQIHPRLSGERQFVDLFVHEAKTLVTLAHGNIVPVYELGVVGETYFIAMEYIDGPTLYRLTERMAQREARMAPAVAAWIAARILEGLDYAHRKGDGVIHRDLSPRNVMLSRDGEIKLVDFGIATVAGVVEAGRGGRGERAGDDGGGSAADDRSAPTGSFPYMSPEQVRRDTLTPQSDLFSLGVLLWEMLVGQRLFARADADATLAAVTAGPIARPSERVADIPAKLDELVMRALERDRGARWQTAGDMLAALQRYLYGLDETPTPRDVEALVARYCPPELRRAPTNLERMPDDDSGAAAAAPAGPSTVVAPRAPVMATKVSPRPRMQTFATHVELAGILAPAPSPPAASPTTSPPAASPTTSPPAGSPTTSPTTSTSPADSAAPPPDAEPAAPSTRSPRARSPVDGVDATEPTYRPLSLGNLPIPGRAAPSYFLLVIAGLGATALAIGAVFIFFHGRDAVLASGIDAGAHAVDATPFLIGPDGGVTRPDAYEPPGPEILVDAAPPVDAPAAHPPGVVDAHVAPLPQLHDAAPQPAADAHTATATLKIGADPWGEIVVDGVPRGRTPAELAVPAGHHSVEIIYRGDDPPRRQTFAIDLAPNQVMPLQADFTK